MMGSQKVHSRLFASRKAKSVVFAFLSNQLLALQVGEFGTPLRGAVMTFCEVINHCQKKGQE